jgi:hypothetical protein
VASSPSATTAGYTPTASKNLRGTHVIVLIDNRDVRVLHRDTGTLIRKLILDPTRDYQPRGTTTGHPKKKPEP